MRILSFILLGAAGLLSLNALAAGSPEDAVNAFYAARFGDATLGAPGGMELAEYSEHLGPELVCLLGAARRFSDAHVRLHPDEIPAYANGDLYSGSARLPSRFELEKAQLKGQQASIRARFLIDGEDGSQSQREALLHLGQHKRQWVIQDIEFSQPADFPLGADSLLGGLRARLGQADPAIGWDARQLEGCPQGNELARLKAAQQKKEALAKKKAASKKKPVKASAAKKTPVKKAPVKKAAAKK